VLEEKEEEEEEEERERTVRQREQGPNLKGVGNTSKPYTKSTRAIFIKKQISWGLHFSKMYFSPKGWPKNSHKFAV